MKTLLVYPEFPDTNWSFRPALSFEGKRSAFPPIGILTISAMLPGGWERRLVDMNIQPLYNLPKRYSRAGINLLLLKHPCSSA
jgi:hypothetical protein